MQPCPTAPALPDDSVPPGFLPDGGELETNIQHFRAKIEVRATLNILILCLGIPWQVVEGSGWKDNGAGARCKLPLHI